MKKNILHVIYQTNIIWWVETFLSTLLSRSKNKDILVQVYNEKNKTLIKNDIINLNETIHSYNPFILLYQIFNRAIKYKQICNNQNISISVSYWDSLNISNILSKILFLNKSNIYIFIHNSLDYYTNTGSFIYKYLFQFLYPKADKVIATSQEMYMELKKKWYKNLDVLYNPLDIKEINKAQDEDLWTYEKLFNNNFKTFITVWRLEEVKNIDYLINNFHTFNKTNTGFQLIIIWDGLKLKFLKKLVSQLWNKNIHFLWKQNNVYKFLKKSDYFIFSSLNEWFWRVLIESLACWTPVLTHDFKYWAKEIIRNNENFSKCINIEINQNWILTPYLDKQLFIEAMEKITTIKFNKDHIRNNIEKYNIEKLHKNWESIITN
jgi:glycosyltransferase involved in cell wall biosynthesis